jgi:ParB family chromosome partitioning protein
MSLQTSDLDSTAKRVGQHVKKAVEELPIELLEPGRFQPRRTFTPQRIDELARSISTDGIMQPILVRPLSDTTPQRYEIIAGERRWRAAQAAGLSCVPVIVRETDDRTTLVQALVENTQREDLNPVETARAIKRLIDEFGFSQRDAAARIGCSPEAVSHHLRILSLSPSVLEMVERRELSLGHAKSLAGTHPRLQKRLAKRAVNEGLSVRALETSVRRSETLQGMPERRVARDPNLERLETRVGELLGAATQVDFDPERRLGRLSFTFHSLEALEGILERLGYSED